MAKRSRDASISSSSENDTAEEKSKYVHIAENSQGSKRPPAVIKCFLPPHSRPYSFSTYDELDEHYTKMHVNRCADCKKNFPTEHFLNLHISENHDSIAEARKARGDRTYGCFVEDCDRFCSTPQKRRLHLIDKHFFPKNYNFFVVNDGLDRRHSMLRQSTHHRRASQQSTTAATAAASTASKATAEQPREKNVTKANHESDFDNTDEEEDQPLEMETASSIDSKSTGQMLTPTSSTENDMDSITKSMSSLKFVPPSVRFGRGRGGGFARR